MTTRRHAALVATFWTPGAIGAVAFLIWCARLLDRHGYGWVGHAIWFAGIASALWWSIYSSVRKLPR